MINELKKLKNWRFKVEEKTSLTTDLFTESLNKSELNGTSFGDKTSNYFVFYGVMSNETKKLKTGIEK